MFGRGQKEAYTNDDLIPPSPPSAEDSSGGQEPVEQNFEDMPLAPEPTAPPEPELESKGSVKVEATTPEEPVAQDAQGERIVHESFLHKPKDEPTSFMSQEVPPKEVSEHDAFKQGEPVRKPEPAPETAFGGFMGEPVTGFTREHPQEHPVKNLPANVNAIDDPVVLRKAIEGSVRASKLQPRHTPTVSKPVM